MTSDVVDLHGFYATGLGQMARRALRRRVRQMWPAAKGEVVLGLGYATPLLGQYLGEAERTIAIMPPTQGVIRWPRETANLVALADDTDLPLPDESIDRVLLVHALEHSEHVRPLLREIWRVLSGSGKLMVCDTSMSLCARFADDNPHQAVRDFLGAQPEWRISPWAAAGFVTCAEDGILERLPPAAEEGR